jgi:hypothetical protein
MGNPGPEKSRILLELAAIDCETEHKVLSVPD